MFLSSIAIITGGAGISIFVQYYFMKKRKSPVQVSQNPPNCKTANDETLQINWHNPIQEANPYLQRITSDKWQNVGKVKKLYIYPIEGGSKFSLKRMHCSNGGCLEINGAGSPPLRDRSFVVYSITPYTNQKTAILKDSKLSVVSAKQSGYMITFSSPDSDLKILVDLNKIFIADTTKVNYGDGTVIDVNDCGDEISTFLTTLVKNPSQTTPRALRLGLYTSDPRGLRHHNKGLTLGSEKERQQHFFQGLLQKHSACTLVNEASVTALREEIIHSSMNKCELTHDFFRPHIVISGDLKKYDEDKIKAVRIGGAVFSYKLPCIHDINVNINPATGNLMLDGQPYSTLMITRPLANIYPVYTDLLATFGINMKVINEGEIIEGDLVYVQY